MLIAGINELTLTLLTRKNVCSIAAGKTLLQKRKEEKQTTDKLIRNVCSVADKKRGLWKRKCEETKQTRTKRSINIVCRVTNGKTRLQKRRLIDQYICSVANGKTNPNRK